MAKKKLPKEVQVVKEHKIRKIDYSKEKNISFSQLQQFHNCKHQWYLNYVKKLGTYTPSIHTVFGTALHETVQHWLDIVYTESVKASNEIDLSEYLLDRMRKTYKKERFRNGHTDFTTSEELEEFWRDGVEILNYLKKKRSLYFTTKGYYLAGIETPLLLEVGPSILFKGYIDLVFYDSTLEKYYILDIKTSTSGWKDYAKKDEVKTSQLILYKEYFAKQFDVPVDNIEIEFFIVKRKVPQDPEFPAMARRVQQFKPASGKIRRGKALKLVQDFISEAFDENGKYVDKHYQASPSKSTCMFCPFKENKYLCKHSIS